MKLCFIISLTSLRIYMKRDSLNVIFIFATSPNTKPEEKNVGWHSILCPTRLKKWGVHVPRFPYLIAPMIVSALGSSVKLTDRRECSFCNYRLLQGFMLYRNLFDFLLSLISLISFWLFWSGPVFNHKNMVCLYTLASLNFTLSVSEYVTTNVTAIPDTFLCEPNPCYVLWSFTCTAV